MRENLRENLPTYLSLPSRLVKMREPLRLALPSDVSVSVALPLESVGVTHSSSSEVENETARVRGERWYQTKTAMAAAMLMAVTTRTMTMVVVVLDPLGGEAPVAVVGLLVGPVSEPVVWHWPVTTATEPEQEKDE